MEPVEEDDDTLHRLENAMAAIRQMPIPPPAVFSMPLAEVSTQTDVTHAFDRLERERFPSRTWGYVFVALAAAITGLWFIYSNSRSASDHAPDRIAFDQEPVSAQAVEGLVSRSEIKEMDFHAVDLERIDDESHSRFSRAIAELKLEFQKPRRFSGYERLEKLLVTFTNQNGTSR